MAERRSIQILPPEEARKIAAGEVIERPASLVREFIDNSLDAEATLIEVSVEEGGSRCTEVSDNGCGMSKEDLEIACETHATSKIRGIDDLRVTHTLGFRGEALAAASAVSRLEILSSTDGESAFLLNIGPGKGSAVIESARRTRGTSVRSYNLFCNLPARKSFLNRNSGEARLCRQVFIEKALAFPETGFRYKEDGVLKLNFPPAGSHRERFAAALCRNETETRFLHEINALGKGYTITIVTGGPELYRNHRHSQFVFANGRRINEFGFIQALEYGTQGAFPNGSHPVGAVFIEIDPGLADFNIHPAKREARFRCAAEIHHSITATLKHYFKNMELAKPWIFEDDFYTTDAGERDFYPAERFNGRFDTREDSVFPGDGHYGSAAYNSGEKWLDYLCVNEKSRNPDDGRSIAEKIARGNCTFSPDGNFAQGDSLRLVGRAFGVFILVEKQGRLFAIDQHAAHERLLYEELISKPVEKQELLVPITFNTESYDDDEYLKCRQKDFEKLGIVLIYENGLWRIEALPALWKLGDAETVNELLALRLAKEDIAERWAATIACHSAIRDGECLDDGSALRLAQEALKLDIKACPHGRPVFFELKKDDFLRAVRRL